jgi:ribosomal protein L7/L12/outer membrane protein assembly factor BamB/DNA-directed RNA polymerase subunit RPC12/RpoP
LTQSFNCPTCGAPIDVDPGQDPVVRCPYCQNTVVVPAELRTEGGQPPVATLASQIIDLGAAANLGSIVQEVLELAQKGQKIQAIKLFRETFGTGLKEAKDAVENLERGVGIDLTSFSVRSGASSPQPDTEEATARIREFLDSGKKIEAIKVYRELTGAGLKEAKDAVEAFQSGGYLVLPGSTAETSSGLIDQTAQLGRVAQLVQAGQRAEAINVYRETFDVSATEADAAIEKIASGDFESVAGRALNTPYISIVRPPLTINPASVVKSAAAAGLGAGCFVWALVAAILLVTLVPVLFALTRPGAPLFEAWARLNPVSPARVALAFGDEGTGPGRFTDPRSIAVENASGKIFVGEYSGGRIQVFDSQGSFITQWTAGDGDGYMPKLAVDRKGTLYAVVSGDILRFDTEDGQSLGAFEYSSDEFGGVYFDDVATTPDGGLVAVTRGEDVLRFDPNLELIQTIPAAISSVSQDSELDAHVAVDGVGNIFLLGTFNNAVFKYSPQGRFVTRFGSDGDEAGQFRAPSAIAVDNQSHVYVSDFKGVQVFDQDGRYLYQFALPGFPFGLAFDDQNRLFAVTNAPRVIRALLRGE